MTKGSNPLTTGAQRAPARAMLKAAGFSDADLRKPLIGVANTWIEIGPCNLHLRTLAEDVKKGVRAAGGTPMEFNTVSISDGITMGTEGMRASLVSREVIADSIELVARGNGFDALVVLVGCDKTIPGAVMALARLNVPGVMLYGGSIAPGQFQGREVTVQDVFEAVGAHAAGRMSDSDFKLLEDTACPGRRRLRRAVHREHDGDCLRSARHLAARQRQRAGDRPGTRRRSRATSARWRSSSRTTGSSRARSSRGRPSRTRLRWSRPPADRPTRCCTCWRSPKEAGVELSLSDFDRISDRTPLVADLKPSGRFVATDLHAAGGSPLVLKRLIEGGFVEGSAMTVTGQTIGEEAAAAVETPGQEVVRSTDRPLKPHGGLVILTGNLAPEGGVLKLSGTERALHRGPARVFDGEEAAMDAVQRQTIAAGRCRRHPLRGAVRRPRDARDARGHGRDRRRRARRFGGAHHRRPVFGGDARLHGRPRRARGLARRADRRPA